MTWNPSNPVATNQIVNDLPDIVENFAYLAFWQMKRSKFTYNGGSTAYTVKVGAGCYYVKDKVAYWVSELTTGAIGTPSASTRYYLYLDYSAITSGTPITTSELVWSSTAPTYSHTYGAWMNGDDRCIFGVITDPVPTNIDEFFHDGGDLVMWAAHNNVGGQINPGTTWTDASFATAMPAFSTKALITLYSTYSDADAIVYWRTNGQAAIVGHLAGLMLAGATQSILQLTVITDTSQVIEVKTGDASVNNTIHDQVDGWYFPLGM